MSMCLGIGFVNRGMNISMYEKQTQKKQTPKNKLFEVNDRQQVQLNQSPKL